MWRSKPQEDWAHQQNRFTQCTLLPKKQDKQRLKSKSWHIRRQMKLISSRSTFYGASFEVPACSAERKTLLMRHCVIFRVVNKLIICGRHSRYEFTHRGERACIQYPLGHGELVYLVYPAGPTIDYSKLEG